ncbi:high affinity Mn2+ porin [Chitinophaga skermanii]|uniref:High affinity Mn2+ porin n=1 Tax=Chitinophaga skermanii TaxID=331697 RepID=A0A327QTI9_9BACT|nr:carbohydrate porin [Chitinophaga skermanii]RAJ06974.1 high affinity Mn2+ porin [Chitinophaga skermanii]
MKKLLVLVAVITVASKEATSQQLFDNKVPYSFHFQQTVVTQAHPDFRADYSGDNSFLTHEQSKTSITATIFAGIRLGKHFELYVNPELAGGAGLSRDEGIAGFPNGETFRVGSPSPKVYVARAYGVLTIPFNNSVETVDDDVNQVAGVTTTRNLQIIVGKYCLADFFDDNTFSHDPRSQFMNWGLMSNGAWDYPADVRGYTYALTLAYRHNNWTVTAATALMPKVANGANLNFNYGQSNGEVIEVAHQHSLKGKKGIVRLLAFINEAPMGSYAQAVQEMPQSPDITTTRRDGRTKYGFGVNIEQQVTKTGGAFLRASWNDGLHETWAFTEIDRSISGGWSQSGAAWQRKNDVWGIACLINGISTDHRKYLQHGGLGFMLGDGNLDYSPEFITETYYKLSFPAIHVALSPGYQFILHPGYNKARGPVHVFGIRAQVTF